MYVDEDVMNDESIRASEIREIEEGSESEDSSGQHELPLAPSESMTPRERLEQELDQAIKVEDYEAAARIRDELSRLKSPS
jgi:excinuclease UvrABC helicase subunit UvrB